MKNNVLPGISSDGAGKALLVKTKNKTLLQILRIKNLWANQVKKLQVRINHEKLVKEESVANNSSNVSGIKTTSSRVIY